MKDRRNGRKYCCTESGVTVLFNTVHNNEQCFLTTLQEIVHPLVNNIHGIRSKMIANQYCFITKHLVYAIQEQL